LRKEKKLSMARKATDCRPLDGIDINKLKPAHAFGGKTGKITKPISN